MAVQRNAHIAIRCNVKTQDSLGIVTAARRSWVLRGVILGFSEEARTRGFPSPSLGGFGFVVSCSY